MAALRLDNNTVAQTNWKQCSQQAWDQRFSIELDRVCVCFSYLKSQSMLLFDIFFKNFN
jgi:hypothetical protein